MKIRADKFLAIAESDSLEKIQERASYHKDKFSGKEMTEEMATSLALLYLRIAMDEGYRKAIQETIDSMPTKHELLPRTPDTCEYVEEGEDLKLLSLLKKRIASKRQRNSQKKHWEKSGVDWSEETFVMCMIVHTGFEAGYLKGSDIKEQAKFICEDSESADLILELFGDFIEGKI